MIPFTCAYFKSLSMGVMGTEVFILFYGHAGSAFLERVDI